MKRQWRFLQINNGPKLRVFVLGLVGLVDCVIGILSLGILYSTLSINYLCWSTKREMEKELVQERVKLEERDEGDN